jgi:hypothetical protein
MEPIIINGEITNYGVYPDGSIRNLKTNRVLKAHVKSDGYVRVSLSINSKTIKFYVHRLVAIAYLDNPENLPCVNHLDNDKLNNCFYNLEWTTQKANIEHKVKCNRQAKGEMCASAKLTENQVLEIRKLYAAGNISQRGLAKKYSVDQRLIWSIIHKETWKHI